MYSGHWFRLPLKRSRMRFAILRPHIKELRVCGGGAKNPLMISELALLNPDLLVTTTADLGVDPPGCGRVSLCVARLSF